MFCIVAIWVRIPDNFWLQYSFSFKAEHKRLDYTRENGKFSKLNSNLVLILRVI